MHIKMPEETTEETPNLIVFEKKRPRTRFSISKYHYKGISRDWVVDDNGDGQIIDI